MWLLLLLVLDADRKYHRVPLARVATSQRTHIETCGVVGYVRKQQDGDWHITLFRGRAFVVLEIIPALPLPVPAKGQTIVARGIRRIDESHQSKRYPRGWPELHPLEAWEPVEQCP